MVCTHTCDTTYQYKTSTIGWPSPACVGDPSGACACGYLVGILVGLHAAFSTCNYRIHACNLDVLMKACVQCSCMCTAVCIVR